MNPFKLNQKIYVIKPDNKETYISAIEKIDEEREITIALPLSKSSSLHVRIGELLTVRLPSEAHCVEFTTPVKQIKIDNVPVYVLQYPEKIKRVQLRKHVRVNMLMNIQFKMMDGSAGEDFKKAVALDISAGGMKIAVPDQIREGESLLVAFDLPVKTGVHSFELETRVMRSSIPDKGTGNIFHLGLLFTDITNFQRDIIFNYIFNRMAELRREGKA
jgi:c-di-GMP-binding flagellar brake protein YcgR